MSALHRLGGRCAAPRLCGPRLHDLPRQRQSQQMYQDLRELTAESTAQGLAVIVWSTRAAQASPRQARPPRRRLHAAAHRSPARRPRDQVKPPSEHIEFEDSKKVLRSTRPSSRRWPNRTKHVIDNTFGGNASSSSRAAKRRAPKPCWKSSPDGQGARSSARSWAATRSSGRGPKASRCSTTSQDLQVGLTEASSRG